MGVSWKVGVITQPGSSNPTCSGKVDRKALAKLIGTGYTEEAMETGGLGAPKCGFIHTYIYI